ncbi:UPF0481 protein At3g47200-like [Malania oleifera]|uniref:UPF0481 protein At3g47200-like n=1 Tax=Malania oleifera TaxID=397392 RepID=UPI0025AE286F|nr:UPF0481 protein At3g47200-like [Malania oleifera]
MVSKGLPPLSRKSCIYRVPKRLRYVNEEAYTPQIVSIGPLHHGKESLLAMEEVKLRYLDKFLVCTNMILETCVEEIKKLEASARDCYSESTKLTSDEFVKMMLIDGSFIIEAMTSFLGTSTSEDSENHTYFKRWTDHPKTISTSEVKHLLDLLRICHLPSSSRPFSEKFDHKYVAIPKATELCEEGVRFARDSPDHLLDIKYTRGLLKIPPLVIQQRTEILLRNLVALEQCHYHYDTYITDYIYFMDNLIDSSSDVDVLVQNGIIMTYFGDSSTVATLFNNLVTETTLASYNYYYYGCAKDIKEFWEVPWHKWKATLKRDYFSTPWKVSSTIAAIVLIVLTFIQTIYSIIGASSSKKVLDLNMAPEVPSCSSVLSSLQLSPQFQKEMLRNEAVLVTISDADIVNQTFYHSAQAMSLTSHLTRCLQKQNENVTLLGNETYVLQTKYQKG